MNSKKGRKKQYYEVEGIRDRRVNKETGNKEYFVKWKDWPEDTNTWEPVSNLSLVMDMVRTFEKSLKQRSSLKDHEQITKPRKQVQGAEIIDVHRTRRIKKARKRSNRFKTSDNRDDDEAEPVTLDDPEKMVLKRTETQKDLKGSNAISQPSSTDCYSPCTGELQNNGCQLIAVDEDDKSEQSVKVVRVRYSTRSQTPKINASAATNSSIVKIEETVEELRQFDMQSIVNGKVEILEAAYVNEQLYYKVRELKGNSKPIFVTSKVFRELNPLLIVEYYAKNI